VLQRRFIAVGMAAFFLMVPLAITSTDKMVKRLGGRNWGRLHTVVYVSGILGVLHYFMLVKSDTSRPLTFGFILAMMLGFRLLAKYYKAPPAQSSVVPPRQI
jgi:sulfoxide reductase heme-binding subunit YedZ